MNESTKKTINDLSDYIQQIIKNGSDNERQLLPELVNALANLYRVNNFQ